MSKKNMDRKGRWRNRTVGFRVSSEEWDAISNKSKLCGYRIKQDFILDSLLDSKVTATGNPLMLVTFRKNLIRIENELRRLNDITEIDEELFTPIYCMLEILEAFEKSYLDNQGS